MALAGDLVILPKIEDPWIPSPLKLLGKHDKAVLLEGVRPGGQRRVRRSAEFLVGALHRGKGIVIKPKPDMKSMLFDGSVRRSPPASTLAAAAPPQLIDGDALELFLPIRIVGDLESGHEGS